MIAVAPLQPDGQRHPLQLIAASQIVAQQDVNLLAFVKQVLCDVMMLSMFRLVALSLHVMRHKHVHQLRSLRLITNTEHVQQAKARTIHVRLKLLQTKVFRMHSANCSRC